MSDAYDMIDRFLRNNLGDDDYADFSAALDSLCVAAPQQAEAVPSDVVRDAERLNYLQCRGATVELLPGTDGFYPMRFRVGGLHAAVSENIRGAIDTAMAQGEKP